MKRRNPTGVHPKLVASAAEALRRVLEFAQPADAVLSHFFREHDALGQTARQFIAESVFGVLRHRRVLEYLLGGASPRQLVLGFQMRWGPQVDLSGALRPGEADRLERVRTTDVSTAPPPVRAELPDWIFERLARTLPEPEVLSLGEALQSPAPLDLRVNTVRADRPTVLRDLAASGIAAQPTPFSPLGVRIDGKPPINRHPLFLTGAVEVQDEGSQLLGYLLSPKRHELVVDFCAGAGGKSLMLGALMHSRGRLYAFDVSAARLARLKPRLKRSGLSNLHPHVLTSEHDTKVKRLAGKIDRVLVDAPCSGLGTLRRNPDLKWRQSPEAVAEMQSRQQAILSAAATLVKPGGRLVYATCSLLEDENDKVVESFLSDHPQFQLRPAAEVLHSHDISVGADPFLRLWPHRHGTDGFFGACLERR